MKLANGEQETFRNLLNPAMYRILDRTLLGNGQQERLTEGFSMVLNFIPHILYFRL
jgi:hypothetical protein